jgi:CubicO group peptidase (beta-lactamase class C family)
MNAKDSIAIEAFIKISKRKRTLQDELAFRESFGEITALEVSTPSNSEVRALLRGSESDGVLLLTLAVSPTEPSEISKFQLEGAEPPEQFEIPRLKLPDVLAQATSRLESMRNADMMSGVVLVARRDQVIFSWVGGLADRQLGTPIDLNTRFRLASIGKMFTAVAVLQLVDTGKLGLDDMVGKYLKNLPKNAAAGRVTIRQLLNHTSGLGDIFNEDFEKNSDRLRTVADYVAMYGREPAAFEPGTQERYSNFGYILLGSLIEAVSGRPYYDYVQQNILNPAGMHLTGFAPEEEYVKGRARPYTKEDGRWVDAGYTLPWRGTPAGGGYSTAGDLLRFSRALQRGVLITPKMRDFATKAQNLKGWYGFGFMVGGRGREARYGHEGGAPGMNTAFFVYPAFDYTVIGLGNLDPSSAGQIVTFIGNRLPLEK